MTDQWIVPDRVFDIGELKTNVALKIEAGRVTATADPRNLAASVNVSPIEGTVTPGFIDLQVNGGGGALVNHTPTVDGIRTIAAAHRRFGTVSIMPTVITDAPDVLASAVQATIALKDEPGIIGLHIEGPHISTARRGTHAEEFIRPLDAITMDIVTDLLAADVTTMITLAPEAATLDKISRLAEMGAIVSLGHTDSTFEETNAALNAGARCVTHLFNAMSPIENREPGAVGAAICSDAFAGIICDGHHVADANVGLAIRARPVPGRIFLVSDAMPTVGGPEEFELYGAKIRLQDGRLVNSEGSLAGAHVTLAESVRRLVSVVGIPAETALQMAVSVPADLIKMPSAATVANRPLTELLVLNEDFGVAGTLSEAVRDAHRLGLAG